MMTTHSQPTTLKVPPTIPTVEEMRTWNEEKVLRWICRKDLNMFEDDDNLNKFKMAEFIGSAFLLSTIDLFIRSGMSLGRSISLYGLVTEVKSKFIPST